MCHHTVRRASNVFDPPPFTGVKSFGFAPTQRSGNERFRSAVGQKNFFPHVSSNNLSHVWVLDVSNFYIINMAIMMFGTKPREATIIQWSLNWVFGFPYVTIIHLNII